MSSLEDIRQVRLEKLNKIKEVGMNPYPTEVDFDFSLKEVVDNFEEDKEVKLVGRIMSLRPQGGLTFFNFTDGTETFQGIIKKEDFDEKDFGFFEDTVDIGDFVQVTGKLFTTKRGQQSVVISDWKMISKSLRPLPEKWHGLQDVEQKYRKRYLDVLMDKEAYNRFIIRANVISKIREILNKENFLEVETPILQNQASGAMAETFKTHHNDYDIDMVLRISLEAELKMIMVGGYPAIYEIGKNFRNEGSDSTHMQEFTMLEWYRAYKNLEYNLELTEKIIKTVAKEVIGKMQFKIVGANEKEVEIDLDKEWERVKFNDLIKENTGWNPEGASREEIEENALKLGFNKDEISKISDGNLLDFIFKKSSRSKIIKPTFVTHYPASLKPLAIQNEDGTAEMAQLVIAGAEITNQYAELVDPTVQKELLEKQAEMKKKGDVEAMEFNSEFVDAMEHGMPPMTGFGMGIDRLVAILTEQSNLRDTVFFPIMKPEQNENKKIENNIEEENQNTDLGIDLEKAQELVDKYIIDPVTKLHSQESELIMRALAQHFGEDEEKWGIIGLLHDLDWDLTKENPAEHTLKTAEILQENGGSEFLIETIWSHNYGYEPCVELKDKVRVTRIQHSLASAETLTGLIVASSLLLPSKSVKDVKLKSLKKRFKEKKFAARCNREIILECEKIGLSIDDFLGLSLQALQDGADKLGI